MIENFETLNENRLFEMCNLQSADTGLPYDIWLDSAGDSRLNTHHKPRIKVLVDGKLIPIEISDNPDIPDNIKRAGVKDFPHLSEIRKYVKAYRKVLAAHYFNEISDKKALALLGDIKDAPKAELSLNDFEEIKASYSLEYYWDTEELIYVLELKDNFNNTLESGSALNENDLFHQILDIQLRYRDHGVKITDISK